MDKDHQNLIQFVLAESSSQPVLKRASLFRALADIAGDPQETANLKAIAAEMEAADARCRQFVFELTEKFHREDTGAQLPAGGSTRTGKATR